MAFNFSQDDDGMGPAPLAEINIVPFVDVMLVLLIITMITSPFMEHGIEVNLPVAGGKSVQAGNTSEEPVTLFVSKNLEISIGKTLLRRENLAAKLGDLFAKRVNKELFVKADKDVPYGVVAEIMSKVKQAGILKVGLITKAE